MTRVRPGTSSPTNGGRVRKGLSALAVIAAAAFAGGLLTDAAGRAEAHEAHATYLRTADPNIILAAVGG